MKDIFCSKIVPPPVLFSQKWTEEVYMTPAACGCRFLKAINFAASHSIRFQFSEHVVTRSNSSDCIAFCAAEVGLQFTCRTLALLSACSEQ